MKPDFTLKLLNWNRSSNNRQMPWKGEKDPFRIWLSEIILQQTRVEQGLRYYEQFIRAFPSIHHLAAADEATVYKLWEGLGYYSRCKNLITTAKKIVEEYNGTFPDTYDDIKKLKGIGPYTAAAISSFAFNEAKAVVDGNVQRVIARYFGISTPINTTEGKKLYQDLAESLLDTDEPGTYNQAIMDFGALICKPQQPLCGICVQQQDCEAFKYGFVKMLPVKKKLIEKKHRWFNYFIFENGNKVLIRQRQEKDIWQRLHEFVLLETEGPVNNFDHSTFLQTLMNNQPYSIISSSKNYRQLLTHQVIHGQFIKVKPLKSFPSVDGYTLINKDSINQFAFPKLINSYLVSED